MANFLPDPRLIFYRPLSREVYFGVVSTFGPEGARWAHVLSAALLALSVGLLGSIGNRLGGARLGFFSSATFASMGTLAVLVGVVGCVQDLLAIVCLLFCLRSHLGGRSIVAVLWMAAALLSKETSAALIPAMIASEWALGRPWQRVKKVAFSYAGLTAVWVAIHPGFHALAARKFGSGGTGYIGLDNPLRFASLGKGLLTAANVPVLGPVTSWSSDYTLPLIGAGAILTAGLLLLSRRTAFKSDLAPVPERRVWVLATIMVLLPLLLSSMLVRNWSPYYSCIPALGGSILMGLALSRMPRLVGGVVLLGYLVLGVLFRQMSLDPSIMTENTARSTAVALNHVNAQFHELYPEMPKGAHALVSVGATGSAGVYTHIHRFQALRIWYADPTLVTLKPANRVPTTSPELLFRITPDLSVVEIAPDAGRFRSAGSKPLLSEIRTVVRSYAKALAASGEATRAASILLSIPDRAPQDRQYDGRLAVALLLAGGREHEAQWIRDRLPPMASADALPLAAATVLEPIQGGDSDEWVLKAFEIRPNDTESIRYLMRYATRSGYAPTALRLARRIELLVPGDQEAGQVVRTFTSGAKKDLLTPPVVDE